MKEISDFSTSVMWWNVKLIHMWRNFRFLLICHVQKFEISPHDRFFLHGHRPCVRDKYQVCFPPRLELKSCLSPAGDQLPGAVTNPLDGDQLTRISLDSRQPLYCLARRHGICGMSRVAGDPWDRDMMHRHQGYHNGDNIKNQQNHLSPYIYTEGRRPPEALKPPYIRQDLIGAQLAL